MSETPLRGIDAHCHLDLYPDPEATLREAESAGVAIIAVTNTPSVFPHMITSAAGHLRVYPALGLHPELATERAGELLQFREFATQTRFIGEVGLDGATRDPKARAKQREVFAEVLKTCRLLGDKVLTVHSRRAEAEVLKMIGPSLPGTVIFHWFSGLESIAGEALKLGAYFSVNPAMLRSRTGQSLVGILPRHRVLTETDGPFLKMGQRPAVPEDVLTCHDSLAAIWEVTPEEARDTVVANFLAAIES
jgi:TatD DNase family protein